MAIIDDFDVKNALAQITADQNGAISKVKGAPWSSAIAYRKDDYVTHNGFEWRCIHNHRPSPYFDESDWIQCPIVVGDYVDFVIDGVKSEILARLAMLEQHVQDMENSSAQEPQEPQESQELGEQESESESNGV